MDARLTISESKEQLAVELPTNPLLLNAAQVEQAIAELSKLRTQMFPPATPLPRQGEPVEVRTDPPWLLAPNALGGATLSAYYVGFGWIHLELSKSVLDELAKAIELARSGSAASGLQ